MSNFKEKKTRFSLNIEQKYAIIKYRDEHPNKKQKDLIEHFNLLFKCRIPPTTMSGILNAPARNKGIIDSDYNNYNISIAQLDLEKKRNEDELEHDIKC